MSRTALRAGVVGAGERERDRRALAQTSVRKQPPGASEGRAFVFEHKVKVAPACTSVEIKPAVMTSLRSTPGSDQGLSPVPAVVFTSRWVGL